MYRIDPVNVTMEELQWSYECMRMRLGISRARRSVLMWIGEGILECHVTLLDCSVFNSLVNETGGIGVRRFTLQNGYTTRSSYAFV